MTDESTGHIDADDELIFAEETEAGDSASATTPWKLLVVDDDDFVHKVTRLVLRDYAFDGVPLEILSAYSGQEGREMLEKHPDVAVILLDVVMETETAGLDFARFVREEIANPHVRIILRTGQPGNAPEGDVIFRYDINDYREKAELTSHKLYTTITAAVRAFRDLREVERNRRGLERIVTGAPTLYGADSPATFAAEVLNLVAAILDGDSDSDGLAGVFVRQESEPMVVSGFGLCVDDAGQSLEKLGHDPLVAVARQALDTGSIVFSGSGFALCLARGEHSRCVVAMDLGRSLEEVDRKLVVTMVDILTSACHHCLSGDG